MCVCVCVCVCVCDVTSIPVHQAVKHEHLEMKKLVLDHEKRQEEEESRGGCGPLSGPHCIN